MKKKAKILTTSNTVKSHARDPFVIKKAEEAKAFFKKAGFPKGK